MLVPEFVHRGPQKPQSPQKSWFLLVLAIWKLDLGVASYPASSELVEQVMALIPASLELASWRLVEQVVAEGLGVVGEGVEVVEGLVDCH